MNIIKFDEGIIHIFSECLKEDMIDEMIKKANENGWEPALLNVGNGKQVYRPETRKCDRSMIIDTELAAKIWELIKHVIPNDTSMGEPIGLNPMFRYLKYAPGDYFKCHYDGTHEDDQGNKSRLTVQMYLNEDYTGGETLFYDYYKVEYTHVPKKGDIVLFDQQILHEGAIVKSGTKMAVRTEVMFKN